MLNTFYRRIARPTCIMAALLSPVLLIGAKGAFESNRNDVLDWLPSSFEETRRLRWFVERFGSDEILVLSWPGCTLEDPRLDALSQHLVRPLPSVDRTRDVVWFRQVITGRQIRAEFMTEPLSLTSAQAVDRMKGWLLGPDGETTCAVALVSVEGSLDRESAVQAACDAASGCGIDRGQLRMGGPTADGAAINEASQRWIVPMGLASALWGLLVALWCLRDMRLVSVVFLTATFAWGISLSILIGAMMTASAALGIAVDDTLHFLVWYRRGLQQRLPRRDAIHFAYRHCATAMLQTTIICGLGLVVFAVSPFMPIARFAVIMTTLLLAALLGDLVLLPALLMSRLGGSSPHTQARQTHLSHHHTSQSNDTTWASHAIKSM